MSLPEFVKYLVGILCFAATLMALQLLKLDIETCLTWGAVLGLGSKLLSWLGISFGIKLMPDVYKVVAIIGLAIFSGAIGSWSMDGLGLSIQQDSVSVESKINDIQELDIPSSIIEETDSAELPDSLPTTNSGIDVQSPDSIINELEHLTTATAFIPKYDSLELFYLINESIAAYFPSDTATLDLQDKFCALLADTIKMTVGTAAEPDADMINGNSTFTSLVSKANEIEADVLANGRSIEKIEEIISLREEAYSIYQTKALRKLLSNDYQSLAHLYQNENNREAVYSSYINAIEYRISYIARLDTLGDDYYAGLYTLGILYQCIGDISYLDSEYREYAYWLSAAFFEIASKYDFEDDEMNLFTSYYCAMANHKLLALNWFYQDISTQVYIVEAYSYYEKSLSFTNYKKQLSYQYLYLGQICDYAQQYIDRFGVGEHMLSESEYAELESEYYKQSY